jgi:biotin synthase
VSSKRYNFEDVKEIYERPFLELVFEAQRVHKEWHRAGEVQLSTLLSIKTGACVEDCAYCAQSARYDTGLKAEPLMGSAEVVERAKAAKEAGAQRFCMGAAWKKVADKDLPELQAMVRGVKELGLETCMTLGSLTANQAQALQLAGLDYYNHNLDTSRDYYKDIISTRCFEERLETLGYVREAGIKVCCGGILGMGESAEDRLGLLLELANLPEAPESVPINRLVPIAGTPLESVPLIEPLEFVRVIATARILMPKAQVRLSAGRESMSEEMQALCFMAGANSIFFGERLLTAPNPQEDADLRLLEKLGMRPQSSLSLEGSR